MLTHVDEKTLMISAVFNEHTYNMFLLSEEHYFGPFLYFWPQPFHACSFSTKKICVLVNNKSTETKGSKMLVDPETLCMLSEI